MTVLMQTRRDALAKMLAGGAVAGAAGALAWPLTGRAADDEMAGWQAAIGHRFRVTGEGRVAQAVLSAVVPADAAGPRPAHVRRHSFWAHFTFDPADAPAGDAIYTLDHPVAGRSTLFLTRAADAAGRVVLSALFN